uniref:C-type lectin domain-containing protein n=1 Tax=Syphacia muris TaxID=451379 RepID=A0A0N5AT20_9BILA
MPRSIYEAEQFCQKNYGGHLIAYEKSEEQKFTTNSTDYSVFELFGVTRDASLANSCCQASLMQTLII